MVIGKRKFYRFLMRKLCFNNFNKIFKIKYSEEIKKKFINETKNDTIKKNINPQQRFSLNNFL
jgi:hypothetical protein